MGRKDLGPPLMLKDFDFNGPQGDTIAITVSPQDTIFVTIKHGSIEIETKINMAIVAKILDGKMGIEAEFFCRQLSAKRTKAHPKDSSQ